MGEAEPNLSAGLLPLVEFAHEREAPDLAGEISDRIPLEDDLELLPQIAAVVRTVRAGGQVAVQDVVGEVPAHRGVVAPLELGTIEADVADVPGVLDRFAVISAQQVVDRQLIPGCVRGGVAQLPPVRGVLERVDGLGRVRRDPVPGLLRERPGERLRPVICKLV